MHLCSRDLHPKLSVGGYCRGCVDGTASNCGSGCRVTAGPGLCRRGIVGQFSRSEKCTIGLSGGCAGSVGGYGSLMMVPG